MARPPALSNPSLPRLRRAAPASLLRRRLDLALRPTVGDAPNRARQIVSNEEGAVLGNRDGGGYGVKYEVDVPITKVGDNEVGLGNNGKDSCQGDSGGPAYARLKNGAWRVFGVVSRGGACGTGGIYGRMNANICWVQEDSGVDLGLSEFCARNQTREP